MSDLATRLAQLSPEKQALLKRRLAASQATAQDAPAIPAAEPVTGAEAIAITGIGCRFPGSANSPEEFWRLLWEGEDAIREIPASRWPAGDFFDADTTRPGKMNTRWGGFIDGVDAFDAAFFGIPADEAAHMDPQQRLILEVCWEALEDAGQTRESLAGSRTGVYVGTHTNDYAWLVLGDANAISGLDSTGTAHSIIANRVSYLLDLHGPSLAVDTACSSGLTAVHLAVHALRAGECTLAVACGVNLLLAPTWSLALARMGMLSPTGRCRSFDADADGMVRSEGCGAVALKRLSQAVADGDAIWAVIRGTAVNQDGRTNGMTAPNGLAKQAVIRAALSDAGVAVETIGAIEAHATGTKLGDSIELDALAEVLGRGDRAKNPCVVGSVKPNIGHPEGAAGIAGLIKLALSLRNEGLPGLVHFGRPSPLLPLEGTRFVLSSERLPWTRSSRPRRGGVSAFGFGGANAHVVLEEGPVEPPRPESSGSRNWPLVLSAHSPAALHERARQLEAWLKGPGKTASLQALTHTAWARRTRLEHGLALAGQTHAQLAAQLAAVLRGESPSGAIRVQRLTERAPGLVFVFADSATLGRGLALKLHASSPAFRTAFDACEAALASSVGWSVHEELMRADSRLAQPGIAQGMLFVVQVALAAWWRELGVVPDAILAEGVGEISAAHVGGALTLDQAVGLLAALLSGDRAPAFATSTPAAAGQGSVPTFSAATGKPITASLRDTDAWVRTLRAPARATEPVRSLVERGHRTFLEIGPHPVLLPWIERAARENPDPAAIAAIRTLDTGLDEELALHAAAGALHLLGYPCSAAVLWPQTPPAVRLPAYPWQRQPFALPDGTAALQARPAPAAATRAADLGPWTTAVTEPGTGGHILQAELGAADLPGVIDHRLHATVTVPAAGMVALMIGAASGLGDVACRLLDGLVIRDALTLGDGRIPVQLSLAPKAPGTYEAALRSRAAGAWTEHATATLMLGDPSPEAAPAERVNAARTMNASNPVASPEFYGELQARGLNYGPAFRPISGFARDGSSAVATLRGGPGVRWDPRAHVPVDLLDGALQALAMLAPPSEQTWVPVRLGTVALHRAVPADGTSFVARAELCTHDATAQRFTGNVLLCDQAGEPLISVDDVVFHPLNPAGSRPREGGTFQLIWERCERTEPQRSPAPGRWVVFHDHAGTAELLADALRQRGAEVVPARFGPNRASSRDGYTLRDGYISDLTHMLGEFARSGAAPISGVVCLNTVDVDSAGSAATAEFHTRQVPAALAEYLNQRSDRDTSSSLRTRLVVVTRGTQDAGDSTVAAPVAASAWGAVRCLSLKHRRIDFTLVDLPTEAGRIDALLEELLQARPAAQVCLRAEGRYEARLAPIDARERATTAQLPVPRNASYRLVAPKPGTLDALEYRPISRRRPGAGEVEIQVTATGLNFRDPLLALGMLREDPIRLGYDAAGVVTRVGSDVADLHAGDAVMAFCSDAFASFVVVAEHRVVRMPGGLTHEQAAALPVAFLTAYHALHTLAKIKPGDHVLIHAATGGVGTAAVQLARRAGCVVYGTAGSPRKRALLRSIGVEQALDSRTLRFADEILQRTGGRGVDVVLNSLSGEYIAKSFACLAEDGRFIEIGKTGIWSPEQARSVRPRAHYAHFDLNHVAREEPEHMRSMLRELLRGFDRGELSAPPITVFPATQTLHAFRAMSQARHVGKIVVAHGREQLFSGTGTCLVCAQEHESAAALANWLASQGAERIALLCPDLDETAARQALAPLREQRVSIFIVRGDPAREEDLRSILSEAGRAPVRSVFIAPPANRAGAAVQALQSATSLDRLTRGLDIRHFVVFTACATVLGTHGDPAIAACGAGVDALVAARRSVGLPAQCVLCGPAAGATPSAADAAGLPPGWRPLTWQAIVALLASIVESGRTQTLVASFDAPTWKSASPGPAEERFLERLNGADSGPPAEAGAMRTEARDDVLARLDGCVGERQRIRLMEGWLRELACDALRLPVERVELGQPLKNLGFDSLLSVEFRNRLEGGLRLSLPATLLWNYPTLALLAVHLVERLGAAGSPNTAPDAVVAAKPQPIADAAAVAALSESEAERALEQRLKDLDTYF